MPYKLKIPQKKTCPQCKKEFLTHFYNQKYCSEECRLVKYLKPKIKKPCVICGKSFLAYRTQKYCSGKCANIGCLRRLEILKTKRKEKIIPEFTCVWCHGKFKLKRITYTRFCSQECRSGYHTIKHQIFMKYPFGDSSKLYAELEAKGKNFVLR